MAIKNLIFDLDGTLIDSSDCVVDAVNYSLRQMGQAEQPTAAIKRYIGFSLETMYQAFTEAPIAELCRHFQVRVAETVEANTIVLEGAELVLQELQERGYRMAIATTKIKRNVRVIVDKFGWERFFDAAAAGDEVAHVKPDPAVLLLALNRLKARAEETLVVGDTVNDILAARAVPMKVAAVSSPYRDSREIRMLEPDYYIESISRLTGILDHSQDRRRKA